MSKNKQNINSFILTFALVLFSISTNAQEVRVIDNKGTVKNINKVSYGTTVPTLTSPSNNIKGDIYIIGTATSPEKTFLFDGTQWVEISSQNDWSLTGNAGTNTSTNFLGTTDNNDLIIKTNNYERMRIGSTAFSPIAEVLINGATPNANTTTNYPLIVRAHGNAGHVLRLQNAGSNQNWNFNARNSSQLDLTYNTNTTPNILFMQSGNVAIGGYPAPELAKLDVFGRLRVRDLPEFNPIQNNAKLIFVTDDGGSTSPNNVLKKTAASAFISEVTPNSAPTGMTSRTIAQHSAGGNNTNISETITTVNNTVTGHKIGDYTNENGTSTDINETNTTITNLNTNTNKRTIGTYNNESGTTYDVEETITSVTNPNTATTKKRIATYNDEANGTTDIEETVTTVSAPITGHKISDYTNENGTTVDINETVTTLQQNQPGATAPVDPTTNTTAGDITYTRENGGTQTVNVVSSDSGNILKVGSDGGTYLKSTTNIVTINSSYVVQDSDYTILVFGRGNGIVNPVTINIPDPTISRGRVIWIKNMRGPAQNIFTSRPFANLLPFGNGNPRTTNVINTLQGVMLQSNGTYWFKIN